LTVHVADSSEKSLFTYRPTGLHMTTTILIVTTAKNFKFYKPYFS